MDDYLKLIRMASEDDGISGIFVVSKYEYEVIIKYDKMFYESIGKEAPKYKSWEEYDNTAYFMGRRLIKQERIMEDQDVH